MIEPLLFFALGLLAAAFIWLLLLPAFWRRATRITRRALEQSLPLTPNEITAERDRLRARFAVEAALSARREEKARADLVAARAETGERLRAEAEHLSTIAARERLLADREVELTTLREQVAAWKGNSRICASRSNSLKPPLRAPASADTLSARHNATLDLAEERRLHLEEKGCEAENLRAALAEETVARLNCAPNSTPARLPCVKRSGVPRRSRTTWLWRASSAEKARVRPDQRLARRAFAPAETCPQGYSVRLPENLSVF